MYPVSHLLLLYLSFRHPRNSTRLGKSQLGTSRTFLVKITSLTPRKVKELSFVVKIGKGSRNAAATGTGKLSDTANGYLTAASCVPS